MTDDRFADVVRIAAGRNSHGAPVFETFRRLRLAKGATC
jgi:hypothetical protein